MRPTLFAFLLLVACNLGGSVELDSGLGDAPEAGDAGNDGSDAVASDAADGDGLADGVIHGGELSFVAIEAELLVDRRCDLDDDGQEDNAIADLGTPYAQLFAGAMTATLMGQAQGVARKMTHLPWVDDVRRLDDDSSVLILFSALDTDEPPDPEDDFSGDEPFLVESGSLDSCGEPIEAFDHAELDRGELLAREGVFVTVIERVDVPLPVPEAMGSIEADGRSAELTMCTVVPIRSLGAIRASERFGDLTVLEVVLAGGHTFGRSEVPGLTPDLDLDGDGLERVELDDDGRIVSCTDGDSTVIDGRDCWQDAQIADAIALVIRFDLVRALFAGRAPDWREDVEGECTEPPEQSLWAPQ